MDTQYVQHINRKTVGRVIKHNAQGVTVRVPNGRKGFKEFWKWTVVSLY